MHHLPGPQKPNGFDFAHSKNLEVLTYSYRVPQREDYDRLIGDFKNHELIVTPYEFVKIPLRERERIWDPEIDSFYYLSMQRDLDHGLVLQRLMQPNTEVVTMHLVAVSLDDLNLTPEHLVGDLFQRSEEVGLTRCPYEALAVMSIVGPPIRQREAMVFVTDVLREGDYHGRHVADKLLTVFNSRNATRFAYGTVYADPDIPIGRMDLDGGIFMGSPRSDGSLHVHRHNPGTYFGWRFMFAIPEQESCLPRANITQSRHCLENMMSVQITELLVSRQPAAQPA